MRTDIIVKVFCTRGELVLLKFKKEEEELKEKYSSIFGQLKLIRLPIKEKKEITARLIQQHAFYRAKEDNKFVHRIIGSKILNKEDKKIITNIIKEKLFEEHLRPEDFEVSFIDTN